MAISLLFFGSHKGFPGKNSEKAKGFPLGDSWVKLPRIVNQIGLLVQYGKRRKSILP
jgi:hypothetical protein